MFSFWRRLVGKGDPPSPEDATERRLWVRYPADMKTSVQLNGKAEPVRMSVVVRDISLGGANLLIDRSFAPGAMLRIELPRSSSGDTLEVLACVVRVDDEGEGHWSIGCVFSRELTDQDLEGFGARKVRHDAKDKRVWMRFPVDLRARIQKVGATVNPLHDGQILNLSPSGVCILVKDQIETGTLLSVDMVNPAGEVVKTMLSCVVHVTGHPEGTFSLGCNFIRQLQEEEFQGLV
jgi:hypothetical protein